MDREEEEAVSSYSTGWKIEVCGEHEANKEMSKFNFQYALIQNSVLKSWMLTPKEEPLLAKVNGARIDKPPMFLVAQYLSYLTGFGFAICSFGSTVFDDKNAGLSAILVLTLST